MPGVKDRIAEARERLFTGRDHVVAADLAREAWAGAAKLPEGGAAMLYYPSLAIVPTAVSHTSLAAARGNHLLLAGIDSVGNQILTDYDPSGGTETQLLGPPVTSDQHEVFHMSYLDEGDKLLFDGQRFSDNQYVIGEYDFTPWLVCRGFGFSPMSGSAL